MSILKTRLKIVEIGNRDIVGGFFYIKSTTPNKVLSQTTVTK